MSFFKCHSPAQGLGLARGPRRGASQASYHARPTPEGAEGLGGPQGAPVDEAKRVFPVDGPIPGWNQW